MAGSAPKYRHLSRSSPHRQSLLRNLVTSLLTHESITTTFAKAKEAQRLAEKLITLGKKNSNASRTRAQQILFTPFRHLDRLFGELRERYADRPGGYTRVLRIESENKHQDQAPSAILELVDGRRDMRFAMTARSLVRERKGEGHRAASAGAGPGEGGAIRDITARNVLKVTRYRKNGEEELTKEVKRLEALEKWKRASRRAERERGGWNTGGVDGEREGWERYDEFAMAQRKNRKLGYKIREYEEKEAERRRLREQ